MQCRLSLLILLKCKLNRRKPPSLETAFVSQGKEYQREQLKQELKGELYGELSDKLDKDVAVATETLRKATEAK